MAMRRRIKVGVNLTAAKRKPKVDPGDKISQDAGDKPISQPIKAEKRHNVPPPNKRQEPNLSPKLPKTEALIENHTNDSAFKYPARVEFNRSNSYTTNTFDELSQSDIDDGAQVMQMDLQRTANGFPMSPSKTQRQRIKATPIFGQRRNSLVGPPSSPSPFPSPNEDTAEPVASPQKRERHYSGSQNMQTQCHTSTKPNHSTGRIRTESTCSVYSDSHISTTPKQRKLDDHSTQRMHARRDFEARFSNGVPDKSSLKMFDLIYYNPATNPIEQKPKLEEIKTETKEEESSPDGEAKNGDNSAIPVPQLKLNAKGELILDDKSLEIETTAEQEARKVLAKSSLIYLDENTGMNGFYKRQKRTRDWAPDETIRFYRCLQTIGTDFSMMCQLFPKRTRRDLKLKFKKEERCNGALINKALLHPNSFEIQELKDQFEIEDRQREEEERTKILYKSIQYKKVNIKTSRSARALKNADDIYNQELRDVEAKKTKRQRKTKSTNNEIAEKPKDEKLKKKRQSKIAQTENKPESAISVESSRNPLIKHEPLCDIAQPKMETPQNVQQSTHTNDYQIENRETVLTPDETQADDVEYELLSIEEYDPLNQVDYFDDFNKSQGQYECLNSENTSESRTFMNLDSGNVTLIRETPCLDGDIGHVKIINNDVIVESDIASITDISTNQEAQTLSEISKTYKLDQCESNEIRQNINLNEKNISEQTEKSFEPEQSPPISTILLNEETEIQKILEDIANGLLVVVSTFNPDSPHDTVNEIYMMDRNTGQLCDDPLDLPQELIQSILSVMT